MNEEAEFEQWYDAESAAWVYPKTTREIAGLAFRQGLALGREGRA